MRGVISVEILSGGDTLIWPSSEEMAGIDKGGIKKDLEGLSCDCRHDIGERLGGFVV